MSGQRPAGREIRRVLVTGAGGFIGRAVVRTLAAQGIAVTAHLGPPGAPGLPATPGTVFAHADIDDGRALLNLAEDVQAIVHLAGPPSVAGSFEDPAGYARAHCLGTANVLAACRAQRVGRLVYVSSAEVYGRPNHNPVAEDAPFAPRSPYAAMKIAAEELVRTWGAAQQLEAIVLRPFSVIGPSVAGHSVLGTILRQAFAFGAVAVQAPGVVRDYVFVDDVASAIVNAMHVPSTAPFRAYNIGTGIGTSVRDLGRAILSILGAAAVVGTAATTDRQRTVDITELVADPRRAATELDWRSRTSLDLALRLIVEAYRQNSDAASAACAS